MGTGPEFSSSIDFNRQICLTSVALAATIIGMMVAGSDYK